MNKNNCQIQCFFACSWFFSRPTFFCLDLFVFVNQFFFCLGLFVFVIQLYNTDENVSPESFKIFEKSKGKSWTLKGKSWTLKGKSWTLKGKSWTLKGVQVWMNQSESMGQKMFPYWCPCTFIAFRFTLCSRVFVSEARRVLRGRG